MYVTAREYMERALVVAQAAANRAECRLIARRICEVLELEDLDEARRLRDASNTTVVEEGMSMNTIALSLAVAAAARVEARTKAPDAERFTLRYLGDPILTTPCTPLDSLADLPPGLLETMRAVCRGQLRELPDTRLGLGIAANQVGGTVAVCLVMLAHDHVLQVLINPRITERSDERVWEPEGCLSIPGFQTNLPRHRSITVAYRDLTFVPQTLRLAGLSARVVQHEVDHLAGRLIVDGLSRQLRRQAERAVEKARR